MALSDTTDDKLIRILSLRHEVLPCGSGSTRCNKCKRYKDLQARIQESINDITTSLSELQTMKSEINQVHSQIDGKIPPELMSRIFEQSLPLISDLASSARSDVYQPVVRLGGVCQRWRNITRSTPQLWKNLLIQLHVDPTPDYIPLVQDWIAQSKYLPLTLAVKYYRRIGIAGSSASAESLFKVIAQSSHRWQSIYISLPDYYIGLLLLKTEDLSQLHNLQLKSNGGRLDQSLWNETLVPKPYTARIFGLSTQQLRIDCSLLTQLEVNGGWGIYGSDCVKLVRSAPMLQACKFRYVLFSCAVFPPYSDLFVHSNMRTFHYDGEKESIDFFSHFTFPFLNTLSCSLDSEQFSMTELSQFHNFLKRSCSVLDSLKLYGSVVNMSASLKQIFNSTPAITKMRLAPLGEDDNSGDDDERGGCDMLYYTLAALSSTTLRSASLLPNLERFEYSLPTPIVSYLEPAIKSFGPLEDIGKPHRRPLKVIEIRTPRRSVTVNEKSKLLKFKKAGVSINLVSRFQDANDSQSINSQINSPPSTGESSDY